MITIKTRIDKHERVSLSAENRSLTVNALIKTQRVLQTVIEQNRVIYIMSDLI